MVVADEVKKAKNIGNLHVYCNQKKWKNCVKSLYCY